MFNPKANSIQINICKKILEGVSKCLSIDKSVIAGNAKDRFSVMSRVVYAYECRERGISLECIGYVINKDHSTMTYHLQDIQKKIKFDRLLKESIDEVDEYLKNFDI